MPCGPHLYCSAHIIHTVAPAQKTSCLVSVGHWIRFHVRMEIVQCASVGFGKIHLGARESNPRPFTASVINLKCFFHMSRDRPTARPLAVVSYLLARARSQGRPSVNVTTNAVMLRNVVWKIQEKHQRRRRDVSRATEPQTPSLPEPWPWMQMGGRDLRQEGDSRERRRGNDSRTRRRKTSGSASWHFW